MLNRRHLLLAAPGLALARAAGAATPGLASGKPHAGQTVKVLCVVASQFRAHEKRLPRFEDETGIKVQYTYVPFLNMREALTAEMVGNTGDYDVVFVMDQWVPLLANLMQPIGPRLAAKQIDPARYPAAHLAACQQGDALLGLPIRGHVQLMFYRKDLFAAAGIAPPTTWDAVVETGRAIQQRNEGVSGVAMIYGRAAAQNLANWHNFLWGAGAAVLDDAGQPGFTTPAAVRATEDFVGVLTRHRVAAPGSATFNEQDAVNSFGQGHSAMLPVWWWVISTLTNPRASKLTAEQVGFVPLPTYNGAPRSTYTNTWGCGLTRSSRRADAAMEFLTWVTRPEMEREILLDPAENDVVALHWSSLRDEAVNARFGGMHRFAAEALERPRTIAYTAAWPQIAEGAAAAISEIAGGAAAGPTLDAAARGLRRALRRG